MLKIKFAREITLIILVKITLLYILWKNCFFPYKVKVSKGLLTTRLLGVSEVETK